MTESVLVLTGAADLIRLQHACPGAEFVEISDTDVLPEAADRATVIVLRSGVALGEPQLIRLPALQHVVRPGSGTDNLDLAALARRGIVLHRHPQAGAAAVAEWVLASALCLTRRIPLGHNALARGLHAKAACVGTPLAEADVAVWGAGPVGRAVGRTLAPFVQQVTFARWPSNPPQLPQQSAHTLIEQSAIHVIALPLRPGTRHLFGEPFLTRIAERSPLLICAGRAETLDLSACLRALGEQRLAGLALDAVEPEHIPLLHTTTEPLNLLATPHIGAQRSDVRTELDTWAGELIVQLTSPQRVSSAAVGGRR
ncbi:NAD(P)-dependent oxidoreductase [Streptacidiphilus albus]|uniref:NAD(P)-dependent oxidoreductase n=1 Tax=Streptacidiphilus albus TaxID=105425 RepID=UPI0005AAC0EA|nr:NAD(P)-dependent oxidoreductase [Streptacidiphilus albus]